MASRAEAGPWVFDADGHVVEPAELWTEYLPRRFRSVAPRILQFDDHFRYVCGDRMGFRIFATAESVGTPGATRGGAASGVARGGSAPAPRLADMAVDAIDLAALYPTYGLMIQGVTEPEPALALCRAVNDWVADYRREDPRRLIGIGTLPMTGPEDALREARRCIEELGFRGVWRRPEHFDGIPRLQDERYEPLWSYLADADAPLAIHPGLNGVIPHPYFEDRFPGDYTAMHAAHFPVEQMMNLTSFVAYGILERHPGLRVAFLESGATWALSYLHRLDEHLETFGFANGRLSMRPSEYFRRQCFVSCEGLEPALEGMLRAYPQSVVFASDYPHGDCTFPGSTRALLTAPQLDEPTRARVLRENALRLYGLDTPAP